MLAALISILVMLASCKKENVIFNIPIVGPDQVFYTLSDNGIYKFNGKDIKAVPEKLAVTGLNSEKLLSIDFRPATGELYGVSDANKIYVIDAYGAAKMISSVAFSLALRPTETISIDFSPTTDQLRVVTSLGKNIRLNPETGALIATDSDINGINGASILGIAHTNNGGAPNTTLYGIDAKAKKLYKQDPENGGKLTEIGNLDLDFGTKVSFDISPNNTNALAVGKVGDSTKLFSIDLATGKAKLSGRFPISMNIESIAIPSAAIAYAVDTKNNFLIFDPTVAGELFSKPITGLQTGEKVLAMDVRPSNGRVYALGSSNRLYTVDLGTAAFTQVGTGTFNFPLSGTTFGFNFNPSSDQIKVVSNTGQNLSINPATAVVISDANLTNATIGGAAYSNNFRGATTTILYVIDYTTHKLYSQIPATGVLTEIGDLKIETAGINGFDIISTKTTNTGYALLKVADLTGLYKIDLATGKATLSGELSTDLTAFTLGLRFP